MGALARTLLGVPWAGPGVPRLTAGEERMGVRAADGVTTAADAAGAMI